MLIDWLREIEAARASLPAPTLAVTYDGPVGEGGSESHRFTCSDGDTYGIKFIGNNHGTRMLATEQVVGALGHYLGAPVPSVTQVSVAQPLLSANGITIGGAPGQAGTHHGSHWERGCGGRLALDHAAEGDNGSRLACLCVLYSWVVAGDHQLIYKNDAPHSVFSVDHGHFFPNGPSWSTASLLVAGPPSIDPFFGPAGLDRRLYEPHAERLAAVTPEVIAACVARIHSSWAVPNDDVCTLADFLLRRVPSTAALFLP